MSSIPPDVGVVAPPFPRSVLSRSDVLSVFFNVSTLAEALSVRKSQVACSYSSYIPLLVII